MASLAEFARLHTDLEGPQFAHLQRLVGAWGLLADFCFADLLLFAPEAADGTGRLVVLGQIRPTTNQTLYRSDWVGTCVAERRAARSWPGASGSGEIIDGEVTSPALKERVRVLAIPVRLRRRS